MKSKLFSIRKIRTFLRRNHALLIFFFVLVVFVLWFLNKSQQQTTQSARDNNLKQSACELTTLKNSALKDRMSLGEKMFFTTKNVTEYLNDDSVTVIQKAIEKKQQGTEFFAEGDCSEAQNFFTQAHKIYSNDPENLIYLNNTKAGLNFFKIAVTIPSGNKPNIALEILRGVAYAQQQINSSVGFNRKKIVIQIVSDDNDPVVVREVAQELVGDSQIIAVIGHNKTESSLEAFPFYKNELVMISATSQGNQLSALNPFIFRTTFDSQAMAKTLSIYAATKAKLKKILLCYAPNDPNSRSFATDFSDNFQDNGGTIIDAECDLSVDYVDYSLKIEAAKKAGAEGLLISPNLDKLTSVIDLANANFAQPKPLTMFGDPTLYTGEILAGEVNGLIVTAPWHPSSHLSFADNMEKFWGGKINWRSATAYDATIALGKALQKSSNRLQLQKVLQSRGFAATGDNGTIKFEPRTGDRRGTPVLIQIIDKQFQLLKESKSSKQ